MKKIILILSVIIIVICLNSCVSTSNYWPGTEWQTSTPEKQGMDSVKLLKVLNVLKNNNINSVTIIRNGHMVLDVYPHPNKKNTRHGIYSCTKSIISALIGIAIDEGYIKSIDTPIIDFFPERQIANLDENKKLITLRHLLIMSSGLDSKESREDNYEGYHKMFESPDWVQYVLDFPMNREPGKKFYYSTCGSFLLSAIISKTTGMSAGEYAKQKLFGPLGITDYVWLSNHDGIPLGGSTISMTPLDMAKIGYLYLKNGIWNDERIISEKWIAESTREHIKVDNFTFYKYAYHWWRIDTSYAAIGYGGQYIIVNPSMNIVVVITSGLEIKSLEYTIPALLNEFILDSIISNKSLPENKEAYSMLQKEIEKLENPKPESIPVLSETANLISGKTYIFEPNLLLKSCSLSFNNNEAIIFMDNVYFGLMEIKIGMDNLYRTTKYDRDAFPLFKGHYKNFIEYHKGIWINENTFKIYKKVMEEPIDAIYLLTFEGDRVDVLYKGIVSRESFKLSGVTDGI